jgi:competence protein ComEC
MRSNILAFALGIGFLQVQERLPAGLLVASVLLAVPPLFWFARRGFLAARAMPALACALLGFCWAALLAEHRLQDQLPGEWEGP